MPSTTRTCASAIDDSERARTAARLRIRGERLRGERSRHEQRGEDTGTLNVEAIFAILRMTESFLALTLQRQFPAPCGVSAQTPGASVPQTPWSVSSDYGTTSNTMRMPVSMCSAMWQCSIHLPGFDNSTSTSTTKPVGTSTVSFHTRFSFGTPFDRHDEKSLAVDVDRVLHRVQRASIVDQAQLRHIADAEAPVDVHVLATRRSVAQDPPGGPSRHDPVHLGHRPAPLHRVAIHRSKFRSGRIGNGSSPA